VQTLVGNNIALLGAWPKTWDARSRLDAPHNTTSEGPVLADQMDKLAVWPESRNKLRINDQDQSDGDKRTGINLAEGLVISH
jgi:hypothetical protein